MKVQTSMASKRNFRRTARFARRLVAPALLLAIAAGVPVNAARPVKPDVSISLETFGLLGFSRQIMETEASLLTVNYVDPAHVLLTFSARTLIQRRTPAKPEEGPAQVEDPGARNVAALLLEWPSGKVVARTQWHMGDYGRYLWALGNGRFILRKANTLTLLDLIKELKAGDAFAEKPLIHEQQPLQTIFVSADGKLLTIETSRQAAASTSTATGTGDVNVTFLRVVETADKKVLLARAGIFRAPDLIYIPVAEAGYLLAEETRANDWSVAFNRFHGGDAMNLARVQSTCTPRMQFVSPSEYVVVSCRGSDDRTTLGSYDLSGRESWEERFVSEGSQPNFAFAPEGGRFVFSRVVPTPPVVNEDGLPTTTAFAQEFRVYGNASGDLLLQVKAAQAMRSGQNFDISPDGLHVLVAHDGVLEQYNLPTLKKNDLLAVNEARALAPPHDDGNVDLKRMLLDASAAEAENRAVGAAAGPASVAVASTTSASARPASPAPPIAGVTASSGELGDPAAPLNVATSPSPREGISEGDSDMPRKKPTLLNPGEKPEIGEAKPRKPKKSDKPDPPVDPNSGSSK